MRIKIYLKLFLSALLFSILTLSSTSYFFSVPVSFKIPGSVIDELNGVEVYYNGSFSHVKERNVSESGYNIGLKWQCVEFVKRYYLEVYNHQMLNSYGNAIDFFNPDLEDGEFNSERGLVQYSNPSSTNPEIGDILIFKNGYGHVAIISKVTSNTVEIIQQNVGFESREIINIKHENESCIMENEGVIGRLRKTIMQKD